MTTSIKVENLSKKYLIGHEKQESYNTLRDSLSHSARSLARRLRHPLQANTETTEVEEFWALKDINFEIKQGDRVGIIGRNGAGKSTLLKILSRITSPTTGKVTLNGRVASLLEVGTGFHPELSGRENIFLNGAILGMRKTEIRSKFDEIVTFAEVEKFLDTPVKRYSSGMYVRLAFAIAAHLEPEILIVDEVLAVGDAQFQKKCLGKMEEISNAGKTVLFVSHNIGIINSFCNKGILMDKGSISETGELDKVLSKYLRKNQDNLSHLYVNSENVQPTAKTWLLEASVLGPDGVPTPTLFIDKSSFIRIVWQLNIPVPFLRVGIEIANSHEVIVASSMDTDSSDLHGIPRLPGLYDETIQLPPFILMPGNYSVKLFAGIPGIERIMETDYILQFEIIDNHTHLSHVSGDRRSGYIAMPLNWEIQYKHAE